FFVSVARADAQPAAGDGTALPAAVPANALAFATLDLRSDTPGMKVLGEMMKPQDRALSEAMLLFLGQLGLAYLGEGLDMEKDVLPWMGQRFHVLALPAAEEGKPPRSLALLEVKDQQAAAAAVSAILARAAETTRGKVEQLTVAGTPLHRLTLPNKTLLEAALKGNLLAVGMEAGALEAWLQAPPSAPGAQPAWTRALATVPPRMLTIALSPSLLGTQGATAAALGVTGVALSSGAGPQGAHMTLTADMTAAPKDSIGERLSLALGQARLAGDALAAVPAGALAAATLAPPGEMLKALGVEPLFYAALGQMLGQQGQALLGRLRPALQQLLAGEVTVALLEMTPQPQAVALFTTPEPTAAAGTLSTIRQALGSVPGVKLAASEAAPDGFALTLPGKNPLTLHVAAVGRWIAAGTDAAAVKAVAGVAGGNPSLAAHPAYQQVHQQVGQGALLEVYLETRTLGRAASTYAVQLAIRQALAKPAQEATPDNPAQPRPGAQAETAPAPNPVDQVAQVLRRVPPAYYARLADAFLLPYGGTGVGLAMRERMASLTLYQQVDWPSVSAATSSLPMMVALALPALVEGRARGREAATAASCQSNLKQLTTALRTYAFEHEGRLPQAENWSVALLPYLPNAEVLRCPADRGQHACSYAMNVRLSGRKLSDILNHEKVVAFFDSDSDAEDPADVGGSLPDPPRHGGVNHVAFLDGHVEALAEVEAGAWVPEMRPAPVAPKTAAPKPAAPTTRAAPATNKKPAVQRRTPTKTRRR
ncbi:MAG: hypothetical protein QHJ73_11175, partial [Armatimonadota bacterium]|nr:hypothetical protein [Armatimonadota bacterium]